MTETDTKMIRLDVEEWMDSPQAAIDAFSAAGEIIVDASTGDEIPAQVAQLLIAAHHTAKSRSERLHLFEPTEGVLRSLELMGLTDLFLENSKL